MYIKAGGVLGTIILFFGWFGFNPGATLGTQGALMNLVALTAVNTLLAGAAGGISTMFDMWWFGPAKKPEPLVSVNGILAGLVARVRNAPQRPAYLLVV